MKQIALNFYEALRWLVGYRPKAMPLTNKWIELDKQEQYRIAQAKMWDENHAKKVCPFWHSKLNTTEKNALKFNVNCKPTAVFNCFGNSEIITDIPVIKQTTNEKLNSIIANNPEFFNRKKTMSDADYIKCDGNGMKTDREFIKYYEPADLHLSHAFIIGATEQVLNDWNFYDYDQDFRDWFFETRYKLINK